MMFRNLTAYTFPLDILTSAQQLTAALEAQPLREIGDQELEVDGFVPVYDDKLFHANGQQVLFSFAKTAKVLPAAVVKAELKKRVDAISKNTGNKVSARQRKELKEQITDEFARRAFSRTTATRAYADLATGHLVIDSATASVCERIITALRHQLGSFPALPLVPGGSPRATFTAWLQAGEPSVSEFVLGTDCTLKCPASDVTWTGRKCDLTAAEIEGHLASGLQAFRLGLEIPDRSSFVLDDNLVVRKFLLTDLILDDLALNEHECIEDEISASFTILHGEVKELLARMASTFECSQ